MKILLAEDDNNISMIAKMALEKIGHHEVIVVDNGLSAIDLATTQNFDLILLDSMMPGKDGLRVCRELINDHHLPTPILFLSAKSQDSDIREGLEAGAIGYIQKPFDPRTLSDEIAKWLQPPDKVAA